MCSEPSLPGTSGLIIQDKANKALLEWEEGFLQK